MMFPACGNTLSNRVAGNVAVDGCRAGCGRVWLDAGEFAMIQVERFSQSARHPELAVTISAAVAVVRLHLRG